MASRPTLSGVTLNGLDLSGVDTDGVEWTVSTLDGWTGSPASTLELTQRSGADGAWTTSRPRLSARVLSASGTIVHRSPQLVSYAVDKLVDAASLDLVRIDVSESGRTRWAMVQRQDEVIVDSSLGTVARWSIQLAQPGALKYGDTFVSSTGLPATAGGLAVPFGLPTALVSTVVSGQATAVNPGNANGPVTLRIDGPVTGPVITHVGSRRALVFSSSLTLAAGEWIDVDMQRHTVLANGTASRAGWVTSRGWSQFEPGPNTWAFAATGSGSGLLTVNATAAWK